MITLAYRVIISNQAYNSLRHEKLVIAGAFRLLHFKSKLKIEKCNNFYSKL